MTKSISLKLFPDERISELPIPRSLKGFKYALTNYGRIISYTTKVKEGSFLRHGLASGYPSITIRIKGANRTFLIHRLVAEHFVKKPDKACKFVIHLNHSKEDNHYRNLKWVSMQQMHKHVLEGRRMQKIANHKLTAAKVVDIKRQIAAGKKTLKAIAEKFGVSDMQISRIKSGENWADIKI